MTRRIKKFDSEENLHQQIVDYIKLRYPGVLFRTDFAAGIKMTQGQAVKHKKLQACRAWPDLFIAAPMYKNKHVDFYGAFLEIKKEGTKLKRDKDCKKPLKGENFIRKKGDWWDQHIEEQANVLQMLGMNGYCVSFVVGFEDAKNFVDRYLKDYKLSAEYEIDENEAENVDKVLNNSGE